MTQTIPRHVSPYAHAPKIFGLKFKIASRVMLVFESILGKLMLVLSICSIIYSPSWYPVFVNFAFLFFVIFSIVTYNLCLSKQSPIYSYPMLSYQLVTIFWLLIWLYAALSAVASGVMWSLESLGGPSTSRIRTSHNIKDPNYANPNETHPETARAIKYGSIIAAVCVILICLKMLAFIVARRTYFQTLKMQHESIEQSVKDDSFDGNESEISNIGGTSPSYPVAYKNRPPKPKRMAILEEVQVEEYTPEPSPAPRRMVKAVINQSEASLSAKYNSLPKYEESAF
ncbi:hypothetical protein CRE_26394 [Caenorhabditis remanei]|uniref:Uncharacterized protein n=3 Tax=Caenorhabditis TaxID=6237 RepID=E3LQ83_CAERE|nr:hypothetical protein CRE_26394 [Caenorhabditis remanei]